MMQGQWIRKAKNGLNVIFIHGINSSEECWQHQNGSYWPDLLKDESELADIGIYVFSYRTGLNTGFYSLSDIVDSLREYFLLDSLISSAGVIFVSHSMGGIVTRRFLVNQHSRLIEGGLNKIGLFLVASPSLGSEYANMLGLVSSVMGHTQANALRFSQNNVWLNDLDKDFINLRTNKDLRIRGKELIEDLPLYGKGVIKKQIVEPFSGAKYFGNSFKVPGSDHSTIATPANRDAVQHRLLVRFVKEFLEEELRTLKPHESLEDKVREQEQLTSVTSNTNVYPETHIQKVETMSHSPGSFSIGGSVGGNVNNVQGNNNRAVQGDNNQAVLGDNNQVTHPNQVGADTETSLTKDNVVKLLTELETLIQRAELPTDTKEEVTEDLSATKKATDKEKPNKKRALERLNSVAETLEKASNTVDAGQLLWSKAKPIIIKVAGWLGAGTGSHLLSL